MAHSASYSAFISDTDLIDNTMTVKGCLAARRRSVTPSVNLEQASSSYIIYINTHQADFG